MIQRERGQQLRMQCKTIPEKRLTASIACFSFFVGAGGLKQKREKKSAAKRRKGKKKVKCWGKNASVSFLQKTKGKFFFFSSSFSTLLLLLSPSRPLGRGLLPVHLRALVPLPPAVVEDQRVVRVARVPPPPLDLGRGLLVELLPLARLLVRLALRLGLVLLLVVRSAAGSGGTGWPRGGHLCSEFGVEGERVEVGAGRGSRKKNEPAD